MTFKYLLYPLLFLTGLGNGLHSAPTEGQASRTGEHGTASDRMAWIDTAGIFDLFEQDFPLIVEENSSDSNDDDNNDGKFFDAGPSASEEQEASHGALSGSAVQVPTAFSFRAHSAALYLLHQVFLI